MSKNNDKLQFVYGIIALLMLCTGVIATFVYAQVDINNNTIEINHLKTNQEKLSDSIIESNNRIVIIETHYSHITNQLDRIEAKLEVLQ